jgi:hypothetical protein
VFAAYGLGSALATDAQLFAALAATYLVVAGVLARPGAHPHPDERGDPPMRRSSCCS